MELTLLSLHMYLYSKVNLNHDLTSFVEPANLVNLRLKVNLGLIKSKIIYNLGKPTNSLHVLTVTFHPNFSTWKMVMASKKGFPRVSSESAIFFFKTYYRYSNEKIFRPIIKNSEKASSTHHYQILLRIQNFCTQPWYKQHQRSKFYRSVHADKPTSEL